MLKSGLNAATYFSLLYYSETVIREMTESLSDTQIKTISSAFARGTQTILSNPLNIIKTRMEMIGFSEYSGTIHAARSMLAKEGVRGLFTGTAVSLIRDVPFSGLFYPSYCAFQTYFASLLGKDMRSLTSAEVVYISSASSFSANILSCVMTHPIDLIRTRIYFQYYNKDPSQQYKSTFDAIRKIYQKDGILGYYRGLLPRIMRKGLGSVLAWAMFEYLIDKKDAFLSFG